MNTRKICAAIIQTAYVDIGAELLSG